MNSDEVNQLIQHYPDIHVLSPEDEASIATKMDLPSRFLVGVTLRPIPGITTLDFGLWRLGSGVLRPGSRL